MMHTEAMMKSHPRRKFDPAVVRLIEACLDCAQSATACADACLSEDMVNGLVTCIGYNLDCADICAATASIATRAMGEGGGVCDSLLEACVRACRRSADECSRHAAMHEHCRICAESCTACADACAALIGSTSPAVRAG